MKLLVLRASEGAVLLGRTGKPDLAISAECRISKSFVGALRRGERSPRPELRTLLHTLYGIPPEAWDRPSEPTTATTKQVVEPAAPPAARVPVISPPPPSPATTTTTMPAGTTELQAAALARAQRLLTEVDAEFGELAECKDSVVRARRRKDLASTIRILLQVTGMGLSEAQIVSHPVFRRVFEELAAATKPWPAAQRAIADYLARVYE